MMRVVCIMMVAYWCVVDKPVSFVADLMPLAQGFYSEKNVSRHIV
jgi:hypothetical protein